MNHPEPSVPMIEKVCAQCQEPNITFEAVAEWDFGQQRLALVHVDEHSAQCNECGCTTIVDRPVTD